MKKQVEIKKIRGNFEIFFYGHDGNRRKINTGEDFKRAKHFSKMIDTWLARGLNPEHELKKINKHVRSGKINLPNGCTVDTRFSDLVDRDLIVRIGNKMKQTGVSLSDFVSEAIAAYLDSCGSDGGQDNTVIGNESGEIAYEIMSGNEAFDFFKESFIGKTDNGKYIAFLGKWVSQKPLDRTKSKTDAEAEVIHHSLSSGKDASLRKMLLGNEIEEIEIPEDDSSDDYSYIIKARHKSNTYTIRFEDMVVQYKAPVTDPATNNAPRTYIFLLGTAFNDPVNLIAFNHTDI